MNVHATSDDDDDTTPQGVYTGHGYVPTKRLDFERLPYVDEAPVLSNACAHEWHAAGFDPNGDNRGLHLYCRRCGKVVIPTPDK